jgi:hypothetical protein
MRSRPTSTPGGAVRRAGPAPPLVAAVEHLEVCGVGSKVDAGRSGLQPGVAIRTCRPVPGGAIGGLHLDLGGALELRGTRVSRALSPPEVEDPAGSLRSFAASLQSRAETVPSSCQARPVTFRPPSRSREMLRRLTADVSSSVRMVSESCHHSPRRGHGGARPRLPCRIRRAGRGVVADGVSPSRSLGARANGRVGRLLTPRLKRPATENRAHARRPPSQSVRTTRSALQEAGRSRPERGSGASPRD